MWVLAEEKKAQAGRPGLKKERTAMETLSEALSDCNCRPRQVYDQSTTGFESVGAILRRMRREGEAHMTREFDLALSLRLDCLIAQEDVWKDGQP